MIFVCFDILSFRLVQIDAHIRCERREGNSLRVDACISSRFEDTGGERCIQHTRSTRCYRKLYVDACSSFRIQYPVEHIRRTVVKSVAGLLNRYCP